MTMQMTATPDATPYELEADAERLRVRIGANMHQLRQQLTPSHLIDEWAESSGIKNITAEKFFDYTARRHPVQTAVVGLGLGLLVLAATRRRTGSGREDLEPNRPNAPGSRLSVGDMLGTLTQTATKSFRERAERKRDEVFAAAKSHVASAAQELSGSMEKTIDDVLSCSSVPAQARPLLVTTAQLIVTAALEALLPKLAGSKSSL